MQDSADGVFTEQGDFVLAPRLDAEKLTELFRHKVLKMLLARGKITRERIRMMAGWNHSGFHVHCGPRIHPDDGDPAGTPRSASGTA